MEWSGVECMGVREGVKTCQVRDGGSLSRKRSDCGQQGGDERAVRKKRRKEY